MIRHSRAIRSAKSTSTIAGREPHKRSGGDVRDRIAHGTHTHTYTMHGTHSGRETALEHSEKAASDVPVLSAAGLIVALSAPLGCAAYMSAVDVDHVDGSAKRRVLI